MGFSTALAGGSGRTKVFKLVDYDARDQEFLSSKGLNCRNRSLQWPPPQSWPRAVLPLLVLQWYVTMKGKGPTINTLSSIPLIRGIEFAREEQHIFLKETSYTRVGMFCNGHHASPALHPLVHCRQLGRVERGCMLVNDVEEENVEFTQQLQGQFPATVAAVTVPTDIIMALSE